LGFSKIIDDKKMKNPPTPEPAIDASIVSPLKKICMIQKIIINIIDITIFRYTLFLDIMFYFTLS
jgi:hypothetical protein